MSRSISSFTKQHPFLVGGILAIGYGIVLLILANRVKRVHPEETTA